MANYQLKDFWVDALEFSRVESAVRPASDKIDTKISFKQNTKLSVAQNATRKKLFKFIFEVTISPPEALSVTAFRLKGIFVAIFESDAETAPTDTEVSNVLTPLAWSSISATVSDAAYKMGLNRFGPIPAPKELQVL